jgi:hypothetical protein
MQIRLWETDRNRVEMIPSHLYEDFPSKVSIALMYKGTSQIRLAYCAVL